MTILFLSIAITGFVLSGHAFAKFTFTSKFRWLLIGLGEILVGVYFLTAYVGQLS